MRTPEQLNEDQAIALQKYAETTLEKLSNEAERNGEDLVALHSALCIASIGWLANQVGVDQTAGMLERLAEAVRLDAPQND